MTKKLIFTILGILLLLVLGYYAYTKWTVSREKVNLWALVPDDAVFVIETGEQVELAAHLKQTEIWKSLADKPYFRRLSYNLNLVDSLSAGRNGLNRFLVNKTILASVHVVSKTDFDFVYYVPVNTVQEHRFVRQLVENLSKNPDLRHETREYQGYIITDIINDATNGSLTYFTYHNNLVISSTSFLVENIIRKINRKKLRSPDQDFTKTNYLLQEDVFAQVYINFRNLPSFLGLFFKDDIYPELEYFSTLCQNGMLEFKLQNNRIFLNGFSNPEDLENTFYQALKGAAPNPFGLQEYIPNRTAVLLHFGLDQVSRLRTDAVKYRNVEPLPPAAVPLTDSLAMLFSREAAVCYLEAYNINTTPEKLAFTYSDQPEQVQELLNELQLAGGAVRLKQDVVKGHKVTAIGGVPELPLHLFGPAFRGFSQSYVVRFGNYFVFADELASLRTLLTDMEAENVWGKSQVQRAFLEEAQHEANFSVYLNNTNAWYIFNRYLTEESREGLLRNEGLLKRFNLLNIQFSRKDKQFYTSVLFRQPEVAAGGAKKEDLTLEFTTKLRHRALNSLFPVRNSTDKSPEVLVQDSALVLYNINAGGKIAWTDSLFSPIKTRVFQAEAGADGKMKYVFATANHIYCLDSRGNDVENFPFNLNDSTDIQHLAFFDMEGNNNHRLLVDDKLGNLYMFDMRGNSIAGWEPRRLDYRLATPPRHFSVNGLDVILVLLENGYVYALDESGDTYPGFPINLRGTLVSDAFAKPGANFKTTLFTVVTQQGELITFNLNGTITERNQMVRTGRRARYELLQDPNEKTFVIARQDLGKVSIYDQEQKLLLERNFVTSSPKIVQYFHFGGDKRIYAITERGPQKTYLYDIKAQLIGKKPIDSSAPVSVIFQEKANQYEIYNTFKNEVRKLTLTP